jgi:hypothetical protein
MMKTKTTFWLAAALAAGFTMGFAGCGNSTMMSTGCSSDSACATGEACHPILKTCVKACTGGSDCPDSAKTCATLTGLAAGNDAGVRAFCQCATDQLCDRATSGDVCQPATKVCAAKCTSSAGCPSGTTCDTVTGKCGAAAVVDAGTDGGMTVTDAGVCTPGSCTGGQICNPATAACGAGAACASANAQPDTCAYGLTCSGAACAEAPRTGVGCANFSTVITPTLWNPVGLTAMAGPVTVSVANRTDDMPFCTNTSVFSGAHELYAAPVALGGTNFPAAGVMLPAGLVNYVRTDGQICDVQRGCGNSGQIFRPSGYLVSNGNKNLTLNFTLCAPSGLTTLSAGFYAEKGNAVCVTMN